MSTRHVFPLALALALAATCAPAQVSVIGDLSQDHEALPGETYEGMIVVRNDSKEPQEAKVYQTDYRFSADGTNTYGEPGSMTRSNARWITFSPSTMVIPPQATVTVNFTIVVPAATPAHDIAGSYWSMLMVEGVPKESRESSQKQNLQKPEMGIRQTLRYGIQIATHVVRGGTRSVRFMQTKLLATPGNTKVLQLDLENTGTLWIRPDVSVELFDEKGISRGKFAGALYRMYPGTSVRQSIDFGVVTPGSYKAVVVVDAGGDDVFGAQYTFTF
jgi:hypothetical protein